MNRREPGRGKARGRNVVTTRRKGRETPRRMHATLRCIDVEREHGEHQGGRGRRRQTHWRGAYRAKVDRGASI
jgi:hypothetical protein